MVRHSSPSEGKLSAEERNQAILDLINQAGFASITALSETLGVSNMTVRRDIRRLAENGDVRMVHGGASLPHGTLKTGTFAARAEQEADAKRLIAEAAARLVRPGSTIAIDSGTTCYALSTLLDRDFTGCVITHSIPVQQQMLSYPGATVLGLGGELLAENQVFIGSTTTAAAASLSIDTFFLAANSVDERGVYLRGNRERPVKEALMNSAAEVVLLVDSSKTQHKAPVRVAELDQIATLVTDAPLTPSMMAACRRGGVKVIVADADEPAAAVDSPSASAARPGPPSSAHR